MDIINSVDFVKFTIEHGYSGGCTYQTKTYLLRRDTLTPATLSDKLFKCVNMDIKEISYFIGGHKFWFTIKDKDGAAIFLSFGESVKEAFCSL